LIDQLLTLGVHHSPSNEIDQQIYILHPKQDGPPVKPSNNEDGQPSSSSSSSKPSESPSKRPSCCDCPCPGSFVEIVDPCIGCCRVIVSQDGPPVKPSKQDGPPIKPSKQDGPPIKPSKQDGPPVKPSKQDGPPVKPSKQDGPPVKPSKQDGPPVKPSNNEDGQSSSSSSSSKPSESPSKRPSCCDCPCPGSFVEIVDPCIRCCRVTVSAVTQCRCPRTPIRPQIENQDTGKETLFFCCTLSGK
jgi:hypothetical protein